MGYQKVREINEDTDYEMYKYICKKLKKHGYTHYEISNFCHPKYESKHNLTYWNNLEYYGFGCGASGYVSGIRYDNTRSLSEYLKGITSTNELVISQKGKMDYEIILGLRKVKGINVKDFFEKYNVNIEEVYPILPLLNSKELIKENDNIMINPHNLYVMNETLIKLV